MKHALAIIVAMAASFALVVGIASEETPKQTIGARFHSETSTDDDGFNGKDISFGRSVPLYKVYEGAQKVKLPAPSFSGLAVEKAIRERKSVRAFSGQALGLSQLAQILLSADGLTRKGQAFAHRAAPSAGALYPIETYVVVSGVDSLPNGLYHFQVQDSSLELIRSGNLSDTVHRIARNQDAAESAPAVIFLAARFDRVTVKYADRGYRYAYMEAGAVCQNIYLEATSLGLGTVVIGAFNDEAADRFLGVDGQGEGALLIMPVGHPTD
jgi:SagB-type dehydrogenase family enzyme